MVEDVPDLLQEVASASSSQHDKYDPERQDQLRGATVCSIQS